VAALSSLILNIGTFDGIWLNWRLGGGLRWKAKDRRSERSGSVIWQARNSKFVAQAFVS
jgi:hypothetical protein